jgi:hypothetical protein
METTNTKYIVIAYGFEYNKVIIKDNNCCIAKSINSKNPVYCSLMIKDVDFNIISNKMGLMKLHYEDYLLDIDKLANEKGLKAKWQLVFYDKDFEYYIHVLQGKIFHYNSNFNPSY